MSIVKKLKILDILVYSILLLNMSVVTYPLASTVNVFEPCSDFIFVDVPHDSTVTEIFIAGVTTVTVYSKKELNKLDTGSDVKNINLFGKRVEHICMDITCTISEESDYKTCTMTKIPRYIINNDSDVFVYPYYIPAPLINSGVLIVTNNIRELLIKSSLLKVVNLNGLSLNIVELGNECIGKIIFINGNVNRVVRHNSKTKIDENDDCQITEIITAN